MRLLALSNSRNQFVDGKQPRADPGQLACFPAKFINFSEFLPFFPKETAAFLH
jgi:hypothetical protein